MSASISRRVLARYLKKSRSVYADSEPIADRLVKYRELVGNFAVHEAPARSYVDIYEQIRKLLSKTPYPSDEITALRKSIPSGGPGSPDTISTILIQQFRGVQYSGQTFCLAALQQVSLPPKLRKSMEAGAKFWAKTPRLPRGGSYEGNLQARTELYVELIDIMRKYEGLFTRVVAEGSVHSSEGDAATKLKVGPFVLVNTGGFPQSVMIEKAKICEEVVHRMQHIGLGKVCYGEVLLTNRLSKKKTVAAFYTPTTDEMFIRADADMNRDTVRIVCHELAHRFEYKFMSAVAREQIRDLYDTLRGRVGKPKKGDKIRAGVLLTVTEVSRSGVEAFDDSGKHYRFPLKKFEELHRIFVPNAYRFVTEYAKSTPTENFAEMVSFHAMGHLPAEQLELLKPLLD